MLFLEDRLHSLEMSDVYTHWNHLSKYFQSWINVFFCFRSSVQRSPNLASISALFRVNLCLFTNSISSWLVGLLYIRDLCAIYLLTNKMFRSLMQIHKVKPLKILVSFTSQQYSYCILLKTLSLWKFHLQF